jgi:hypothetical protein
MAKCTLPQRGIEGSLQPASKNANTSKDGIFKFKISYWLHSRS